MKFLLALLLLASPALAGGPPIVSRLIVPIGQVANCGEALEMRLLTRLGRDSLIAAGLEDFDCVATPYAPARMRLCCPTANLCGPLTDTTSCVGGACPWARCRRTVTP